MEGWIKRELFCFLREQAPRSPSNKRVDQNRQVAPLDAVPGFRLRNSATFDRRPRWLGLGQPSPLLNSLAIARPEATFTPDAERIWPVGGASVQKCALVSDGAYP